MEGKAPEAGWRTYLKAGVFLAPGILAWAFVAVYVLPKFKQIWRDADLIDNRISEFQWIIGGVSFAMDHIGLVLLLTGAALVALEFTGEVWRRFRRPVLGGLVFVFNSAMIVGLVGACLTAAIAGPALAQR
jgi:hypothetical protein